MLVLCGQRHTCAFVCNDVSIVSLSGAGMGFLGAATIWVGIRQHKAIGSLGRWTMDVVTVSDWVLCVWGNNGRRPPLPGQWANWKCSVWSGNLLTELTNIERQFRMQHVRGNRCTGDIFQVVHSLLKDLPNKCTLAWRKAWTLVCKWLN